MSKILSIIGPTASGKSDFALYLAERLNGEIISADSVQIYRGLDIGSAKPSSAERQSIPHHLIDTLDITEQYSVGRFVRDTTQILAQILKRGKTPIIAGGTFLYIRAFFEGIHAMPAISPELRQSLRTIQQQQGIAYCYDWLAQIDRESARKLHPKDTLRILRALEVVLQSGRTLPSHQRNRCKPSHPYTPLFMRITPERTRLYERINARVLAMVKAGLIEETEHLLQAGYRPSDPGLLSIGYKEAVAHIQGHYSQAEMIAQIQKQTRRYAKRQITWSKNYQHSSLSFSHPMEITASPQAVLQHLQEQIMQGD